MLRRIVLATAAAAALILAPTVATAAPTLSCTASSSTPTVGEPVKVICTNGTPKQKVTLNIDGTASGTKTLAANGVGTFSAKFTTPGPHTVTMTSSAPVVTLTFAVVPKYQGPSYTFTVTDSTPSVGAPFAVNVSGVDANTAVTLAITSDSASVTDAAIVIAGTKSFQSMADAAGLVGFDVTLASAGVFDLVGTNAAGAVIGSQKVTVGAIAAPVVAPSDTGFGGIGLAIGAGLLLLLLAAAFVLVARRRKSADAAA